MASKIDITAKLGLDGSGFEKGLDKASRDLAKFGAGELGSLKGMLAQAFTVTAVVAYGKAVVDLGGKIKDTSTRLGITTDEVQELGFAAEQSGSDIDAVAKGIEHISKAREAVIAGGPEGEKMLKIFEKMGVGFKSIIEHSPKDTFYALADGLRDANVAGGIQAGLLQLMGKGAGSLIPVMKELRDKQREFKSSGGLISKADVEALDDIGDFWNKAGKVALATGAGVVTTLASVGTMAGKHSVGGSPSDDQKALNIASIPGAIAAMAHPSYSDTPNNYEAQMAAIHQQMEQRLEERRAKNEERKQRRIDMKTGEFNRFADETDQSAKDKNKWISEHPMGKIGSDSLLSVGNFLGAGGRQVMDAPMKAIETNTRQTYESIMKLISIVQQQQIGSGVP